MATRTPNRLVRNNEAAVTYNAFSTAVVEDKFLVKDDDAIGIMIEYTKATTAAETANVTVSAGDAWQSDLGALVVTIGSTAGGASPVRKFIGPLESARFKDSSGYINYSVSLDSSGAASTTAPTGSGNVVIFEMPNKVKFST